MRPKLVRISTVPQSLFGLLKGQLRFLNNHFEVVGISSDGVALEKVGKREGIRVTAVEMERKIHLLKDLRALFRLYRQLKKEKPEIVHSITPKAGLLSMWAAKMAGVPIRMHTFTGLIFPTKTGGMRWLLIQMDRLLCWAATHVYPEGEGVKNDMKKYHITSKPLKIIAHGNVNGVDLKEFDPEKISTSTSMHVRQELGIKSNDFVFLFVGRVVGDKGINELVQAFNELTMECFNLTRKSVNSGTLVNTHLVIVGNYESQLDPLQTQTKEEIQNHSYIHAVGYQSNVADYFAMADVLTFPSYREGFPNVVLQAAAMQLNCIVTDINGCNEIITDGENGWIVPPKNVAQLKEKMLWCYEHPEESEAMGKKSRRLIQEKYAREYVWEELLKEYKSILR